MNPQAKLHQALQVLRDTCARTGQAEATLAVDHRTTVTYIAGAGATVTGISGVHLDIPDAQVLAVTTEPTS